MSPPEALAAVVVFGFAGATVFTLARAVAQRIAGRGGPAQRELTDMQDEVDRMRTELDAVQARLGEMDDIQNRLDFAERMLAQVRERGALPGGKS